MARFRALPNDSPLKTVIVTLAVSLVGSIVVAGSAVLLKPLHDANKERERQRHVARIYEHFPGVGVRVAAEEIGRLEARVVDLATGDYVPTIDASAFDQQAAAKDPRQRIEIPPDLDIAQIKRRAKFAVVYLVRKEGRLVLLILPVHGTGFGSTLYGYLGLADDGETVVGLSFYEHGETPGLGALVDSPDWQRQWRGKKVWDEAGNPRLGVATGPVDPASPEARYLVDGLTGATWTSRGISNLVRYWLGDHGFGPYLRKIRNK